MVCSSLLSSIGGLGEFSSAKLSLHTTPFPAECLLRHWGVQSGPQCCWEGKVTNSRGKGKGERREVCGEAAL